MAFKKVYDLEEADFWLAFEDERRGYLKDRVTPGKYYKLELLDDDFIDIRGDLVENKEYFIIDDLGQKGMHYQVWRGEYVKEV